MPKREQGVFKEKGRVRVTDNSEIVVSDIWEGDKLKALNINKYIVSQKYTGFTQGTPIPNEMIPSFLALFNKEDLELALAEKEKKV